MMVLGGLRCCGGIRGVWQAPEEWITDWTQALQQLIDRIGPCFQRPEPRRRVGRCVAGLLSEVERRNGWQLAEHAGEATPDGMPRLLYQAKWDADAVCAQVVDDVGEHLGTPEGVLVIDDSGIPKKGTKSAGVAPQYCGVRHAVVNCQVGVFACYVSGRGMALVDRELYLPAVWTTDRERCQAAVCPSRSGLRPSRSWRWGCLRGCSAAWVAADAVYGPDTWLRAWLEGHGMGYVLGIRASDHLEVASGAGASWPAS